MDYHQPTLLCWHSHRAGVEVLERALGALSNRRIKIAQVVYLLQEGNEPEALMLDDIEIETLTFSLKDPTNHLEIYELLRGSVLPFVREHEALHINVSPGTPAMHTAWLVLHAGGHFPANTRLWSSQYSRETKRTRIDPVDFPISTYLSQLRKRLDKESGVAVYDTEAKSVARRQALERLARYAQVPGAPLLVLGKRGSGKTRTVETLVAAVKGRDNVVTVPCGGLDSSLVDSILFGYKKGAFTGAEKDRPGLLAEANGGILFLDEVQDLPQHAQRKLIRVFQDRERRYRPLGSDKEEKVDIELICASNLPLKKLQKRLDPDFFDRISHLVVEIPPLQDCRDDLYDDWQRVWRELRLAEDLPKTAPWGREFERALNQAPLPGNLRDLQRLALLLMAWLPGNTTKEAIKKALAEWKQSVKTSEPSTIQFGEGSRKERLQWFQGHLAEWAKEQYGTWREAAEALDCDEKTLRLDGKRLVHEQKVTD